MDTQRSFHTTICGMGTQWLTGWLRNYLVFLNKEMTIFRFGYKLYRFIPYFLEIRYLLDWICSDSSLELVDWFKMEDVTQSLFDQKVWPKL